MQHKFSIFESSLRHGLSAMVQISEDLYETSVTLQVYLTAQWQSIKRAEFGPASPGSVPSTRPGVGLSALSVRRRSTGARVPFSHDAAALWAPPSITATYGRNTPGRTDRQTDRELWDQRSTTIILLRHGHQARVITTLWSDFNPLYFVRSYRPKAQSHSCCYKQLE